MRGGDGRGSPVSRRMLAACGAVLLTSTAAAVDADARAHGPGTQPRPAPNVPVDRAVGTSGPPGTQASTSSGPGEALYRRLAAGPEALRAGSAASGVGPVRDAAAAAAAPAVLR